MKEQVLERAQTAIEDVLCGQPRGAALRVLSMGPEVDGDGEEFLYIRLVYEGGADALDSDTTIGLSRRMRSAFEEADVEAFPVLSFVARSDLD